MPSGIYERKPYMRIYSGNRNNQAICPKTSLWKKRSGVRKPRTPKRRRLLTKRQAMILRLFARGLKAPEIAAKLDISINTIRIHMAAARLRAGAVTQMHLVVLAIRAGVVRYRLRETVNQ